MHYMASPLSFRWEQEFIDRIDAARGGEKRSAFVRRAVERALEQRSGDATAARSAAPPPDEGPVPAEQPRDMYRGPEVEQRFGLVRASSLVKRDVRPVPKKK